MFFYFKITNYNVTLIKITTIIQYIRKYGLIFSLNLYNILHRSLFPSRRVREMWLNRSWQGADSRYLIHSPFTGIYYPDSSGYMNEPADYCRLFFLIDAYKILCMFDT